MTSAVDTLNAKTQSALDRCLQPNQLCGADVRSIRKAMGLTGLRLAEVLGIDNSTLSRWERDKRQVGLLADKALRMAAILCLQGAPHGEESIGRRVVFLKIYKS